MRLSKYTTRFIVAILTFTLGLTALWFAKAKMNQPFRLVVPEARWVPIYFRDVDVVAKSAGLNDLKKASVTQNDVEVRVWWGFGLAPLEGLILKRTANHWSAQHIKADQYYQPKNATSEELSAPRSGWKSFWQGLVEDGVMTLPDGEGINCIVGGLDGIAYVVESNNGAEYRTYMYDMPTLGKCQEAKQVGKIGDTIFEEFRLGEINKGAE